MYFHLTVFNAHVFSRNSFLCIALVGKHDHQLERRCKCHSSVVFFLIFFLNYNMRHVNGPTPNFTA